MHSVPIVSVEREASILDRKEAVGFIRGMAREDVLALRSLYARYNRVLFGILLKTLNDRGEAEEALQDLFVRAWSKAPTYDPERASPFTWLAMMGRSIAIDKLRKRLRRPEHSDLEEVAHAVPNAGPSADELADIRDESRQLENLLHCLSPHQRKCIYLAYFKGLSQIEIADRMNRPLGSVKSDIRRGLLRLRTIIQNRDHSTTT